VGKGGHDQSWSTILSLSFFYFLFVKGDSYPEPCAQRTDEGGGFLIVTREGTRSEGPPGGLEHSFFCLSFSYISHGDESCETRIYYVLLLTYRAKCVS
jgi:hypothetical protein